MKLPWRATPAAAAVLLLALGCQPKAPAAGDEPYRGPTLPLAELAERVNENNSRWRQFARRLDTPASHVIEVVEAPAPAGMDPGEAIDLWNQVQSLPRQQRAVVVLRFYEDLSEAQTAEVLGCSVGTVKSHTSRALGALRTRMSEATA